MNGGTYETQRYDGEHHAAMSNGGGVGISQQQPPQQRTLYVGNLDQRSTQEELYACFEPFGSIVSLKLINENVQEPYCFIEYENHGNASIAMSAMNKRIWSNKELNVNWATSTASSNHKGIGGVGGAGSGLAGGLHKPDTSKHFHIFVGDLSPEIDTPLLHAAFAPIGQISDCRVVRDSQTSKSRCYGFVSFANKQDAESAIAKMNGQMLGSRAIRTNWASRRPPTSRQHETPNHHHGSNGRALSYDEVIGQTCPTNFTVYCGGLFNGLSDELIQRLFQRFGPIQDIRVFKEKGYAFVKFTSKDAATNAIVAMHNQDVNGQTIKCSWGKNDQDTSGATVAAVAANMMNQAQHQAQFAQSMGAATNYLYSPFPQMSQFWYQPGAMAAMAAQSQISGLTGMQYPSPYGNQFYPSTSPSHHNGYMMAAAQMAAGGMAPPTSQHGQSAAGPQPPPQQQQQQAPSTTPNGVGGGLGQQQPSQQSQIQNPQAHQHPVNVQNVSQPPPSQQNHFGAYQPQPVMAAYPQMQ